MSSDLLEKEKHFYELNERIEVKNKALLKEIDTVMKIPDDLLKISNGNGYEQICSPAPPVAASKNIYFLDIQDCKDLNIPTEVNNMGKKGLSIFLKGKLKKMQFDFDKLQLEYKTKSEDIIKLEKENNRLMDEKEKWFQIANIAKSHLNSLESQMTNLKTKMQNKDIENGTLKKQIEQLHKDLKTTKMETVSTDTKIGKCSEEIEKLKGHLKRSNQDEKELRETHKKAVNELGTVIKRLEKQKDELLNGFKKQSLLIDNLKKQKRHIECFKVAEMGESDFMKLLEWKVED